MPAKFSFNFLPDKLAIVLSMNRPSFNSCFKLESHDRPGQNKNEIESLKIAFELNALIVGSMEAP